MYFWLENRQIQSKNRYLELDGSDCLKTWIYPSIRDIEEKILKNIK